MAGGLRADKTEMAEGICVAHDGSGVRSWRGESEGNLRNDSHYERTED